MRRLWLLALVSCGSSVPDPTHLTEVLIPTPAKIDFGFVPAGQTVTQELTLHNAGKVQLHLKAPIVSQAGMGYSAMNFPVQLMPNETLQGQVLFAADATEGHATGNIDLGATEFDDTVLVELKADAGI